MAENKQYFPGFIGPSDKTRIDRFDAQRTINMYLEASPENISGTGKGNQPAYLVATPGLRKVVELSTGPIRGIHVRSNSEVLYVVSGNLLFQMTGDLQTPMLVLGTLRTSTGPVSMADNGNDLMFVDGDFGYYVTMDAPVPQITQITDANFHPASTITFQDGYFILNHVGTGYYFISDLYSTSFLPLNEALKSGSSDDITGVICNNRFLYLFGSQTTEIWWDAGQSGSTPFVRQEGSFIQTGCIASGSIVQIFNTIMWLGENPQGGGIVYIMDGTGNNKRVSTPAVEFDIQSKGDLRAATAYAYQQEGHYFYCLNVPGTNTTWVYDLSTDMWHERQSNVNGVIGRHIGECHAYFNEKHVIGDATSGNLYYYDLDYHYDNEAPITKVRQAPHISENLNNVFYKMLQIDCTTGVGLNSGEFTDPRVVLEISNDGGQTWGNPIFASIGKIGAYKTRCRWNRLGYSRDRVFRVSCSDPVKFALLSALLDIEIGNA